MARDQLDEIRAKIDLVELVSEYLPLKKAGRNFKALCPFHSEAAPSFIVSPERQIFKCFGCFPAGTQIKTPQGIRPVEKLKKQDLVISGKSNQRKILYKHKRFYRGNLVTLHLRKMGEGISLTEDHQVFVVDGPNYKRKYKNFSRRIRKYENFSEEKYQKKMLRYFPHKKMSAGNIKTGDCLLYPINRKVEDIKNIDLEKFVTKFLPPHGAKPKLIPYRILVEKDFLKLLGYWIAEGSNHRAYIRFSLGSHEEEFAKEIQDLIKKLFGLETKIHRRKGSRTGLELTCCHSFLANIFENLCGKGAVNKHIPFVFNNLPPEKQELVLKAILKGDGYAFKGNKTKSTYYAITTVSNILAIQLRDIILRLGCFPTETILKDRVDSTGVSHRKAYTITWSREAKSRYKLVYRQPDGAEYWVLPVKRTRKNPFSGWVYNLTLDADHSYISKDFIVANCGEGGDAFGFLMKMEGLEFGEALQTLAKRVGVKLRSYRPSEGEKQKQRLYEINHLASEFYHYLLLKHPAGKAALDYILGRGITRASLEKFKIGFAPRMWDGLQKFLVGKKGYQAEELEKAGLVIKRQKDPHNSQPITHNSFYDRFRNRLVFPLRDHRGNVCGFAGRVLDPKQIEAKYVNTPETLIYHKSDLLYGLIEVKQAIKGADEAIVVEGELDMISSFQAGVENVVAIKGSALTETQVTILKRFTENLILALDQDVAGDKATRRGIEVADAAGMAIKVISVRGGKDPDEVAQKNPALWRQLAKTAVPVYDYFVDSALNRFDPQTAEGKRQISRELGPILAKINDEIVKAHYVGLLAGRIGVNQEAIMDQLTKVKVDQRKPSGQFQPDSAATESRSQEERLQEHLLALAFQSGQWRWLRKRTVVSLVKAPRFARILKALKNYLKRYKTCQSERLAKMLPAELRDIFNSLYLLPLSGLVEEEDRLAREFNQTLERLKKIFLKRKFKDTVEQIKVLENTKLTPAAEKRLEKLEAKLSDLTRKLGKQTNVVK